LNHFITFLLLSKWCNNCWYQQHEWY